MRDEKKTPISLKTHLASQAKRAEVLLATVEGLPDAKVKLTPWSAGVGCLCLLSFVVDEDAIEGLLPTGEVLACCGHHQLDVVEVTFTNKHKPIAAVVSHQVAAAAVHASTTRGSGNQQWCLQNAANCRFWCGMYHKYGTFEAQCLECKMHNCPGT